MAAVFELDRYRELPLWAQVLLAARLTRAAALHLPDDTPELVRGALLSGCEALERCARDGTRSEADLAQIDAAQSVAAPAGIEHATEALRWAADAAYAASDATDMYGAEGACINSTGQSLAHAAHSPGLGPLPAHIRATSDVDLLRFACAELSIKRYDALGTDVLARLHPVHPPATRQASLTIDDSDDPTHGAR